MPLTLSSLSGSPTILTVTDLTKSPELLRQIQARLSELGWYPPHAIDGVWGRMTGSAIASFCKSVHLDNYKTGKYGASFAKALLEATNKPTPKTQQDHIRLIIAECKSQGVAQPQQIAYILATVYHETAHTYEPVDEIEGYRMRYAPFWGRGYVQLTWERNYRKYKALTGKDLVGHPDLAKEPYTAAFILVHGFKTGGFTGRKLSLYIDKNKCDFRNARRCINGMDRAELIAQYAQDWLKELTRLGIT